ncbi:hypothetical protein JW835_10555 [bacterium]|nr:hypothetical protein [bacterium]
MKTDPFLVRGVIILLLAITGFLYEVFTDREIFVLIMYTILASVGWFLILKVRK